MSCRGSRVAAWRKARAEGSPDRLTFARAGTMTTAVFPRNAGSTTRLPPRTFSGCPSAPTARAIRNGATSDCPAARLLALHAHEPAASRAERPRVQSHARALLPEAPEPVERAAPDVGRRVGEQGPLDGRRAAAAVGRQLDERGRARPAIAAERHPGPRERRRGALARNVVEGDRKAQQPALEAVGLHLPERERAAGVVHRERRVHVDAARLGHRREAARRVARDAAEGLDVAGAERVEHVARDAQLAAQRLAVDLGRRCERGRVGRIGLAAVAAGRLRERAAGDAARDRVGRGRAHRAARAARAPAPRASSPAHRRGSGSGARRSRALRSCARAARAPSRRAAPAGRARRAAARAPSARRRARRRAGSRPGSPPRSAAGPRSGCRADARRSRGRAPAPARGG